MKKLTILSLLLIGFLAANAQSGATLTRNGKAQVNDWEILRDSIKFNGVSYRFITAYDRDNVRIGYFFKNNCRYKIRIELYDNPIKRVTTYSSKGVIIEDFGNYTEK